MIEFGAELGGEVEVLSLPFVALTVAWLRSYLKISV